MVMNRITRLTGLGSALLTCTVFFCTNTAAQNQPSTPSTADAPGPSNSAPTTTQSVANPLHEAITFARAGNFDGAIEKYQEILRSNPKNPDALAGIVRSYLKKKDVARAADEAKTALTLSDAHTVLTAVAEVYFRQGRIEDAEREWVKVINSGFPDARAYLGVARVRRALSMYMSAKKLTDKAFELDPSDPDIQRAWLATLPPAERIPYLERFLAGPNDADLEERGDTQRYLDYLKARLNLPNRGCRLVNKITATETPLVRLLIDAQHFRGYGLSVSVNGHKSDLRLDTGASGIVLNRPAAEKAGITKISETRIWGIGSKGSKHGYLAVADSIKVGELEFQNCTIEVVEGRSVAEEQGLIGADVFGSFLVDIDFPNEKFKLAELPKRPDDHAAGVALRAEDSDEPDISGDESQAGSAPAEPKPKPKPAMQFHDRYVAPEMKSYTTIFRFGHELLVPTKIGDETTRKLFLLDSGGFNNLISLAAAREVTKVHGSDTIVKGVSGSVDKVYRADKATLEFGRLRQQNEDLVAFDLTPISDDTGIEISGFLGFAMLRMLEVRIDYRDGLVDFNYDAKRWGR
jgi:tetratricopeptide (TPR) repeat protein